jgi:type I restriction enzyme R subunit
MREARKRGDELGLSEEELAFYDALANNQSAVEVMGDEQLAFIAKELIQAVRKNVSIDWTLRQSARARIRVVVKRILRRYGYPPDLQEAATRTVLEQAELLAAEWAE